MLSTKFKNLKKVAVLGAIAAACGFAKADTNEGFEDIQALPNGQVLVHNTDTNGVANIQGIKTPFMFANADADLKIGFTSTALTNATSVASDGTNCYANVNGKVLPFQLKNGFPAVADEDLAGYEMDYDAPNPTQSLGVRDSKILAATEDGFVATFNDGKDCIVKFTRKEEGSVTNYVAESVYGDFWATPRLSYDDGKYVFVLSDEDLVKMNKSDGTAEDVSPISDLTDVTSFAVVKDGENDKFVFGHNDGTISINNGEKQSIGLPGSGSNTHTVISVSQQNPSDVYVTTGEANQYVKVDTVHGAVSDPMPIGNSSDKVKKVIDNPKKMDKMLLFITQQRMGVLTKGE